MLNHQCDKSYKIRNQKAFTETKECNNNEFAQDMGKKKWPKVKVRLQNWYLKEGVNE